MDGRTLMDIMQSPNFSMWGPAEQAFNTTQDKAKADLASTLGVEKRAVENHPLEQQVKQANIRQSDAAAGYSTSMKKQIDDNLAVLGQIPMSDRVNNHIAKMRGELSESQLKQTDAEMQGLLGAAAAAAKNRGTLPLGYTLQNPKHAEYFKNPQGAALAMQIAKAYFMNKPTELAAVSNDARETSRAVQVANIGAAAREKAAALSAQRAALKPPKTNTEAAYYYQRMAETAETEAERDAYMAKAEQAREAEKQKWIQQAILAAQQRMAGGVNLEGQGVDTNPLPGASVPQGRSSAPAAKPKGDGLKDNPIVLR